MVVVVNVLPNSFSHHLGVRSVLKPMRKAMSVPTFTALKQTPPVTFAPAAKAEESMY